VPEAQSIQNQFTGLRDPRAEYEEADAYVIALASEDEWHRRDARDARR